MLPDAAVRRAAVVRARGARRHAAVRAHRQPTGSGAFRPRARGAARSSAARCWCTKTSASSSIRASTRSRSRARCSSTLRHGRVVSGGSTLTMQLARLSRGVGWRRRTHVAREGRRDRCWRCGSSAPTTRTSCSRCTPRNAPFGGNVVGLEAAPWRYFGREPATTCRGRKRRRSRCCPTIPRSCTCRATARGCGEARSVAAPAARGGRSRRRSISTRADEPLAAAPHACPISRRTCSTRCARSIPDRHRLAARSMRGCRRTRSRSVSEHSGSTARGSRSSQLPRRS